MATWDRIVLQRPSLSEVVLRNRFLTCIKKVPSLKYVWSKYDLMENGDNRRSSRWLIDRTRVHIDRATESSRRAEDLRMDDRENSNKEKQRAAAAAAAQKKKDDAAAKKKDDEKVSLETAAAAGQDSKAP